MGLMERNKQHPMPRPLRRIAIISSPTAAGYQDFYETSGGRVQAPFIDKALFRATMQGKSASRSPCRSTRKGAPARDALDLRSSYEVGEPLPI